MASYDPSPGDDGSLRALFEGSPDRDVHTSAAAESALLLGLVAIVTAPFSMMYTVSLVSGALGVFFALIGLATTSRPNIAGGALVPAGLGFAFSAVLLVGLRYVGLDTAFGDGLVPSIRAGLESLNARFPGP